MKINGTLYNKDRMKISIMSKALPGKISGFLHKGMFWLRFM